MKPQQQRQIIARSVEEGIVRKAEEIRQEAIRGVMASALIVLHAKHQFTPFALKKVMKQIFEQCELVNGKYVTMDDFYRELSDLGINFGGG